MAKFYSTTLQKGSQGDEVKEWQKFLNSQGYSLGVDGDFGDKTYAATTEWQRKNGLGDDGIVGEKTWGKAGYSNMNTPKSAPEVEKAPTMEKSFNTQRTDLPPIKSLPDEPTYDTTSWDTTKKGQAALGGYNSAKDAVNKYGDFTYEDYTEGDKVTAAGDALNSHLANKPGAYQSQWQSQLDALMNSIMNRDKFSYNMNEDALYQQYKDKYIEQGKMAMADTMGQAAAMTGGYGNSYAQSVGQQAYQGQLDNLNDIVPELYQMALDKYNREGQELYNQYGMVMDRENTDYGRYRDTVSDFLTERDYLQGRYDTERGFDYSKYVDDRNLDHALHQDGYQKLLDSLGIAQSDYYDGANMFHSEQATKNSVEGQKFNDAMSIWGAESDQAWKEYQASETARRDENTLIQNNWKNEFDVWDANTDNAWKQAQWDEAARQYANEEAWRQKEWDENNRRYEESKVTSSGSGDNGGNGGNNTGGAAFADTLWNATGTYDSNGNPVFRNSEGKTQAFGQGVNPYTGTKHPDAKHGTFSNGYQPNNIGGTKLKNSGMSTNITGKSQTIWEANGKYWLWRGDLNKYIEVDVSDLG
jgi:peptidoglycan hydrolase-like protein with peptidoglycan-binding domain